MMKRLLVGLAVAGVFAASGAATAGPVIGPITFSEFAVGTVVIDQYASLGVVFSANPANGNYPIIADDGAMPGSPVLSPNPPYAGVFDMEFLRSTTFVQFDSGFWNEIGSGVITVIDRLGNITQATNSVTGVETFSFTDTDGIARIVFDSSRDSAGADIDNLIFNVPEPGMLALLGIGGLLAGWRRRVERN